MGSPFVLCDGRTDKGHDRLISVLSSVNSLPCRCPAGTPGNGETRTVAVSRGFRTRKGGTSLRPGPDRFPSLRHLPSCAEDVRVPEPLPRGVETPIRISPFFFCNEQTSSNQTTRSSRPETAEKQPSSPNGETARRISRTPHFSDASHLPNAALLKRLALFKGRASHALGIFQTPRIPPFRRRLTLVSSRTDPEHTPCGHKKTQVRRARSVKISR